MKFPRTKSLWVPSDNGATLVIDTTLPGGMVPGTEPGSRVLWDWASNNHCVQTTAAKQGTLSFLGPSGAPSITLNGATVQWNPNATLGAGTDMTLVVGANTAASNSTAFVHILNGGTWNVFGMQTTNIGITDQVGANVSGLAVAAGVHAYGWVCATAGTCRCWLDQTKDASDITYRPLAPATYFSIGAGGVYTPITGAIFRLAFFPSALSDTLMAKAQRWAVRAP